MTRFVPRWLRLAGMRIAAQVRCGRCLSCPWCEDISILEGQK